MVTKAIARAQKQVEAQNFGTRKHLLEYDDVMNKQRENVYALRRELLEGKITLAEDDVVDSRGYVMAVAEELIEELVETHASKDLDSAEWDMGGIERAVCDLFGLEPEAVAALDLAQVPQSDIADRVFEMAAAKFDEKEKTLGIDPMLLRRIERDIMLQIVDAQWKDHLYSLDHLKEGIGLRGYGQRDPLVEYKKESFALFQAMKARIDEETVRYLWRLRPVMSDGGEAPAAPPVKLAPRKQTPLTLSGGSSAASGPPRPARTGGDDAPVKQVKRDEPKIGRNDPCYCGSGKKYKKCHGA
jgi:preprotein translocase subunit SecA